MFVSYAQNFEDVMLHRVFGSVGDGFYIDVGAWHPETDSVTKHFYDMGWSGINIEPSKYYFRLLEKRRERDINLRVAVGTRAGELDFVEVPGSGLSSLHLDAAAHATRYGFSTRRYKVPVVPLQSICERYCPGKLISFLKIDVEGSERDVIESLDWKTIRPVLVMVEAVHPETKLPIWDAWEPTLLGAGYVFVWFDGLNRYYLRCESQELKNHFLTPPGFPDGFVIKPNHALCMRLRTRVRLALSEAIHVRVHNFAARIHSCVRS